MSENRNEHKANRKRKKNKLALFGAVFAAVILSGSLLLLCLSFFTRKQIDEFSLTTEIASGRPDEGNLLQTIKSELAAVTGEQPTGKYAALLQDAEAMQNMNTYAKETASGEETVLAFAGDILFDDHYAVMATLNKKGGDIRQAFSKDLLEEMTKADLFMLNNEFTYSNRGTPTEGKQFTFRASTDKAENLKTMGVDVVSLANNHAYDYGEVSLTDTLDALQKAGIPYVGAGRNLEEASKPVCFIMNDQKIAIVSATQIERQDHPNTKGATKEDPGVFRCWNPEKLLEVVKKAKTENDMVIVYIHWGTENQTETDWAQNEQAIKIAEAGADLIVGDHPHCLQPVGFAGNVPIIYSLGNFWFNSKSLDTCLLKVRLDQEKKMSVQVLPAKQENCMTMLLNGEERMRVLTWINSVSTSGYLDEDGFLHKK